MTKLHDILREFIEDVQTYLLVTLNTEILSTNALARKESLLMKIQHIRREIPLLVKVDEFGIPVPPPRPPPKPSNGTKDNNQRSPAPYIDMQGSVNTKPAFQPSPVSEHKTPSADTERVEEEEDYEAYEYESETSVESSHKTDKSVLTNSEDNLLDENSAKFGQYPEIAAPDLARSADKCGYLEKKGKERLGGLFNPFQKRYCAIKDGLLLYYNDPNDRKQRGNILLAGYEGRHSPSGCKDANKKICCFEIVSPGKKTYHFIAYSVKDMKQWIAAIEKNAKKILPNNDVSPNCLPKEVLPVNKPLPPPVNINDLSVRPKAKPPLPIPLCHDEDIYEAVEETFNNHNHGDDDDEPLYEEGASWRVSGDHEEIYIDADGEAPKPFPENMLDFKPGEWYVGLWDCKPADETELEFNHGDLIRIISKEYDKHDWWTGKLNGKVGFVPKAYLQEAYEKPSE